MQIEIKKNKLKQQHSYQTKTDFKIKTRDKGDYIKIKASIQEDTTTKNIHTTNIGAPRYIRQMLRAIKGEIENNTIIVGDVNTPLASTDR